MIKKIDPNIAMRFFFIIYDVIWLSGPISVLFLGWKIKIFLVKMNALYMVILCLIQSAGKFLTWNQSLSTKQEAANFSSKSFNLTEPFEFYKLKVNVDMCIKEMLHIPAGTIWFLLLLFIYGYQFVR